MDPGWVGQLDGVDRGSSIWCHAGADPGSYPIIRFLMTKYESSTPSPLDITPALTNDRFMGRNTNRPLGYKVIAHSYPQIMKQQGVK